MVGHTPPVYPISKADPPPMTMNPVIEIAVDPEIAREAFTYTVASGKEGTVHIEQALEYDQDPGCLRGQLLYRLTPTAVSPKSGPATHTPARTRGARFRPASTQEPRRPPGVDILVFDNRFPV
jgi:hypothetical protein